MPARVLEYVPADPAAPRPTPPRAWVRCDLYSVLAGDQDEAEGSDVYVPPETPGTQGDILREYAGGKFLVPVHFPGNWGGWSRGELLPGELGKLVFADRSLDTWQVDGGVGQRRLQLGGVRVVLGLGVQQLVRQFLEPLEAQIGAAHHQERRDRPRRKGADQQRGRHQDGLVDQRALGHRPHHRQFAVGVDAADLLRVQGEVVAQHPGGLLGGDLGHHRNVVEQGRDVVEQGEETGGHGDQAMAAAGNLRIRPLFLRAASAATRAGWTPRPRPAPRGWPPVPAPACGRTATAG